MELIALTMAWFGVLGLGTALVNVVALRAVRVDEVPGWVQTRVRWWSAHNRAFLVISAAVMIIGLLTLAVSGR